MPVDKAESAKSVVLSLSILLLTFSRTKMFTKENLLIASCAVIIIDSEENYAVMEEKMILGMSKSSK